MHRSDGSGTTFAFTNSLSSFSPEFKSKVGEGKSVKWPVGVGGKGNEGVAANVNRVKGSIGYVEYAYVKKNNMNFLQVQNADGKYVSPDDLTFAAAAAGAEQVVVAIPDVHHGRASAAVQQRIDKTDIGVTGLRSGLVCQRDCRGEERSGEPEAPRGPLLSEFWALAGQKFLLGRESFSRKFRGKYSFYLFY